MLEHRARDAKPPLRRLIRIGRRTDDDGLAERNVFEIGGERAHNLFLYKDAPLKCLPPVLAAIVGKLGVGQLAGVMRALDDVAVRIAGIAVAASEFAADVRIEGPVIHSGRCGRIENALRCDRDESGPAEALVENRSRQAVWRLGGYGER